MRGLERALSLITIPKLPLHEPHMWFVHEIIQSKLQESLHPGMSESSLIACDLCNLIPEATQVLLLNEEIKCLCEYLKYPKCN